GFRKQQELVPEFGSQETRSLSCIFAFCFVTELTSTIYVMMDLADLPVGIGQGTIGHVLKGVSRAQGTVQ
ncbi:hypothetical protein LEMLEM_LOCUS8585, partial [Lemmus lemmus]